jgi:hypothetical protein
MANEAVLVERWSHPSDFTVADGTAIAKGALLQLTDPRTALAPTGVNMVAGIAAREKVASDGRTNLAVYQDGLFRVYLSGGGAVGQDVGLTNGTYPNHVTVVNSGGITLSGAYRVGTLLETGVNNEQVLIRLTAGE